MSLKHIKNIDISITPFTNSLPIHNLDFRRGKLQPGTVIYIDVLAEKIKTANQVYEKTSATTYTYYSPAKDFVAPIKVDKYGFVLFYPGLFERINFRQTAQ